MPLDKSKFFLVLIALSLVFIDPLRALAGEDQTASLENLREGESAQSTPRVFELRLEGAEEETRRGMSLVGLQVFAPTLKGHSTSPALFLFPGFMPFADRVYEELAIRVAAEGIPVIMPIYHVSDPNQPLHERLSDATDIAKHGYESLEIVEELLELLDRFNERGFPAWNKPWVVYAHSAGAKVALHFASDTRVNERIKSVLLSGYPSDALVDVSDPCSKPHLELPMPVTFLVMENDVFAPSAYEAYRECVEAPYKQYVSVSGYIPGTGGKKVEADHFSDFASSDGSPIAVKNFLEKITRFKADRDIHHYPIHYDWNRIDEYGVLDPIVAMTKSHEATASPEREDARELFYGEDMNLWPVTGEDKPLRFRMYSTGALEFVD